MAGYCTVCSHSGREEIDSALIRGRPSFRELSKKYGVACSSLSRHKRGHLHAMLAKVAAAREETAVEQLKALRVHALRLLKKAEAARDYPTSITCVRELARLVALTAAAAPAPPPVKQRVQLAFTTGGLPLTRILPAIDAEVVDDDGAALL